MVEKMIKRLDDGILFVGDFLDFSKAFDTVDHDILARKVSCYGVGNSASAYFQIYLANRKQFVTYNTVSSTSNGA